MLKREHLNEEIKELESTAKELKNQKNIFGFALIKGIILILKMLADIRRNQVIMIPPDKLVKKDNEK